MSSIILYGAGSPILGDVEDTCRRLGRTIEAVVQNLAEAGPREPGRRIVRPEELTAARLKLCFVLPLFGPANREFAWSEAKGLGARLFEPVVDPTTILPSRLTLEEGVYVNCGVVVGSHARLGRFSFVNRAAIVGHHAELDEFVSVGPGANLGSLVRVGRGALIGTGAIIASGVQIGAGAIVGIGAVVLRDVPPGVTVLGNPARVAKTADS